MTRVADIMVMNYTELCSFFNEEKQKSRKKELQFNRWRKEYSIVKIEGKNQYAVRKLLTVEQARKLSEKKRYSYVQVIEPIIYDLLKNAKTNEVTGYYVVKPVELMENIGLTNVLYPRLNDENIFKRAMTEYGLTSKDLNNFKKEVYSLNDRTIKRVLTAMFKKDLLTWNKVFAVRIGNVEKTLSPHETTALQNLRKNLSFARYGKDFFALEDEQKGEINEDIKQQLGYDSYYLVYEMTLNHEGIVDDIARGNYTYATNKMLVNEQTKLKIKQSTQGELKGIDDKDVNKMVDVFIDTVNAELYLKELTGFGRRARF